MKKTCHRNRIVQPLLHNIYLAAIICAIFSGLICAAFSSDEGSANLSDINSSQAVEGGIEGPADYNYNQSDSASPDQLNEERLISGIGYGELLLTFTVNKALPVFSGRYSYDVEGIHIPPISNPMQVKSTDETGYSYDLSNVFIPGKPNNFTVSVSGVKTLSIGLKELPGSSETNDVWKTDEPRTWISTQAQADESGTATIDSDLVSPGMYHAKIFGEAAENVSEVNLRMTVVKKLVVNGPYNLSLNTAGFPEGDYSIKIKALNGTFRIDGMSIEM